MNRLTRNIFFDLFGVLIGADPSAVTHYVSTRLDIPYNQARSILYGDKLKRLERHEISFKQYFSDITDALPCGEKLEYEIFNARWNQIGLSELPAVGLLSELSKQHRVLILTNASNQMIRQFKTRFNFLRDVDGIITSEDAGIMKPSPDIYRFAFQKFQTDPRQSVMIDDSQTNVRTAIQMGMTGHHYTHFDGLLKFLADLTS